jgi:hypothetical protein
MRQADFRTLFPFGGDEGVAELRSGNILLNSVFHEFSRVASGVY